MEKLTLVVCKPKGLQLKSPSSAVSVWNSANESSTEELRALLNRALLLLTLNEGNKTKAELGEGVSIRSRGNMIDLGECPEFTRNVSFLLPYFAFYGNYIDERRRYLSAHLVNAQREKFPSSACVSWGGRRSGSSTSPPTLISHFVSYPHHLLSPASFARFVAFSL